LHKVTLCICIWRSLRSQTRHAMWLLNGVRLYRDVPTQSDSAVGPLHGVRLYRDVTTESDSAVGPLHGAVITCSKQSDSEVCEGPAQVQTLDRGLQAVKPHGVATARRLTTCTVHTWAFRRITRRNSKSNRRQIPAYATIGVCWTLPRPNDLCG
jgi:hypothetical protein